MRLRLFILIAFVIVSSCGSTTKPSAGGTSRATASEKNKAINLAQTLVSKNLKAPRTVQWGESTVLASKQSRHVVLVICDAQNSFGAQIRSNFLCAVTLGQDGQYSYRKGFACLEIKDQSEPSANELGSSHDFGCLKIDDRSEPSAKELVLFERLNGWFVEEDILAEQQKQHMEEENREQARKDQANENAIAVQRQTEADAKQRETQRQSDQAKAILDKERADREERDRKEQEEIKVKQCQAEAAAKQRRIIELERLNGEIKQNLKKIIAIQAQKIQKNDTLFNDFKKEVIEKSQSVNEQRKEGYLVPEKAIKNWREECVKSLCEKFDDTSNKALKETLPFQMKVDDLNTEMIALNERPIKLPTPDNLSLFHREQLLHRITLTETNDSAKKIIEQFPYSTEAIDAEIILMHYPDTANFVNESVTQKFSMIALKNTMSLLEKYLDAKSDVNADTDKNFTGTERGSFTQEKGDDKKENINQKNQKQMTAKERRELEMGRHK